MVFAASAQRFYTVEEFWQFARQPAQDGHRLELEEGVIVEMASSSPRNTIIAGRIIHFFNAFVLPRNLGYVTVPDGGFKLGSNRARQPDAAFVSKLRAPEIPREFTFAPDIAVEIVSENEDVLKKTVEYLKAGAVLVWNVYDDEKTVYVFTLNEDGSLRGIPYGIDDTLDTDAVLPGFALPVRDIFP
jgi:Uma2 family endonuclease